MRKVLLISLLPIFLTACATEGKFSDLNNFDELEDCGEGGTWVGVRYEDSSLAIKSRIHVKAGTGVEFRLKPKTSRSDPVNYKEMLVTIQGKESDPDAAWIDVSGTYDESGGSLFVCADTDPGTYHYLVSVENLGILDPRADVD